MFTTIFYETDVRSEEWTMIWLEELLIDIITVKMRVLTCPVKTV